METAVRTTGVMKKARIVFGLEDIQRVVIRCLRCRGELSVVNRHIGPDGRTNVINAETCPHCGHSWKAENQSVREEKEAETKLLDALDHFTSEKFIDRVSKGEVKRDFKLELPGDIY